MEDGGEGEEDQMGSAGTEPEGAGIKERGKKKKKKSVFKREEWEWMELEEGTRGLGRRRRFLRGSFCVTAQINRGGGGHTRQTQRGHPPRW